MPDADHEPDPPVADADSDADAVSRLADDVPAATARRKRLARQAAGRPVKRNRKPRCPACGYFFSVIESWSCPRCQADLRETGISNPASPVQRFAALLRAIARRLRRRPRNGMACGRCEYPARGVGGFDCPECGSDLRQVGIIDRDRIHRGGAIAIALTLWSVLLVTVAVLLSDWLYTWAIPQTMSRRSSIALEGPAPTFKFAPGLIVLSNTPVADYLVTLQGTGNATQWRFAGPVPIGVMVITIKRGGRFVAVRIDVANDTYSTATGLVDNYLGNSDKVVDEGSGFTGVVLARAMQRVGINPRDPAAVAQGGEIMDAYFALQDDTLGALKLSHFRTSTSASSKSAPSLSHRVLIPLYWLALWLLTSAALAWLLWRRMRPSSTSLSTAFTARCA